MVVRMRANRSKTGKRRSHQGLVAARAARCSCGALRLPHRACAECGMYRGKVVIDVVARAKRQARRDKRREKDLRESGQASQAKQEDKMPTAT
ncbi:50S ribosomal protein L32 [Candidatus Kaiserbacteria bacterium CG10_big_fil_rev_8_21_14_0_10_59_10]|uniref:Large ribosomal subunit protein bL32 n=1 Tax=Candidatus Kaiserbacteria bacterium CG10_big_fil_rev_8_21_14_0_10_59_10 TaxID=1974612 RepID=A0A2H0U8X6_9BACT|nr:MAG: 50S ribosomal protein L32 [Candidatus Kaiserbacteria bacterium CG10_big_fil_rev_8_21_14_0_10_59_10]